MAQPGAYSGGPPQPWNPGMGGAIPQDMRQGQGPPRAPAGGGPPPPPPPQMQGMPRFSGYEQVGGFDQMAYMPPPPPPPPPQDPPPMEFTDIAQLDAQGCKAAMLQYVSENCCYGSKPAKEMTITNHKGITALHYILETFGESRSTGYKTEPYKGGFVDGPENGPPPPPWAIPCQPDSMFKDDTKKIEVPHTASVKPCHSCHARGWDLCWRCHGWGQVICTQCDGRGFKHITDPQGNPTTVVCSCGGDGKERCTTCGGDGRITCDTCKGYAQLKCFIQLKVKYDNHKDDHILERSDLPDELVRQVGGKLIFEQVLPMVPPIVAYPVKEINDNSIRLVNKHRGAWPNERCLSQRQTLRGVPVTEVNYTWENVNSRFWVYGFERKVYCPDYPQQCCCGCSVL
ncbi:hypothetical protein CHS0354_038330 [Potamilus streckersoni]|uniref:Protein SSUH2 homolog n=1 Tax=Potamilus streckersoni TaxID=2493646 RepID=A0AAE0S5W2_9BIVA|nr:hypothetical protein CHS0354_038330 [Potamilus streckersoni]